MFTPWARDPNAMDIDRLTIREQDKYMKQGKCLWCGQTGHMSCDHITNPSLNAGKGNTSNFSKTTTPYKAIMPPSSKGNNTAQKVCAIMAKLDNEELEEAKTAFIECLDSDSKQTEELKNF